LLPPEHSGGTSLKKIKEKDNNYIVKQALKMEAVARLRNYPTSPRKMRLIADLIRGQKVGSALSMLKFNTKYGATAVEKLLISAISNWKLKNEETRLEDADLYIKEIRVDGGKMLKRLRPAPQGRAHRIRKRSNHVTLVVDSAVNVEVLSDNKDKE
jgi:large subunit ribosomal protein L22